LRLGADLAPPGTSYRLTPEGRKAFRRYRKTWHKLTGGRLD
jgi:DNA-binding PadR family transcriptional regulator